MLTILGAALAGSAVPQSRPAFEVATLKAAAPSNARGSMRGGVGTSDPGLFVCTNMPLRALILRAWNIPAFQLSGPRSMETARYDISARVPLRATREEFDLMIQNLLAERLHLVLHEEGTERGVYQMAIAMADSR